jgi:hypothetical protein
MPRRGVRLRCVSSRQIGHDTWGGCGGGPEERRRGFRAYQSQRRSLRPDGPTQSVAKKTQQAERLPQNRPRPRSREVRGEREQTRSLFFPIFFFFFFFFARQERPRRARGAARRTARTTDGRQMAESAWHGGG